MPEVSLSNIQKKALAVLADYLQASERTGEEIHLRLHEMKTEIPIQPKELFQAIYRIFLNRDSGPKAGWFLAGLPRAFVGVDRGGSLPGGDLHGNDLPAQDAPGDSFGRSGRRL